MRSDEDLKRHIRDEILFIQNQMKSMTEDEFYENEILKRAISRSLEIIGEAVKNLSDEFKDLYPDINWRGIAGMRDRLIHGYFSVDYSLVYDVIKTKIPEISHIFIQ